MKKKTYSITAIAIVLVFIFLDQILKIWVRTNMDFDETISLCGDWLNLHFIENEGMAFGISFGENFGKLMLSLVRIAVVGYLIYFFIQKIKKNQIDLITTCILSLIIAGALGNIIDSAFYGIYFDYAPFMYGRVVDMFYVKLFLIPDWVPYFGGAYFFPAIFNIADSCVTVGVIGMLCFNKRFFRDFKQDKKVQPELSDNQVFNNEDKV